MGCFYDLSGKRVWVAGHRGMVGAALVRRLARENCHVLTVPRAEVDLTRQAEVEAWMAETRPQAVFLGRRQSWRYPCQPHPAGAIPL